ncbi:MAG: hypothetical protein Q8P15_00220 [Nanoarchaeota archaeon]|nr:hypothetical protein [Nanoarchaeota archaeon]
MNIKTKAWAYGIIAVLIVLLINFIVLYSLDFPLMAIEIIKKYWFLLIFLIGGFGTQVGLFTYYHSLDAISCSTTVASGGISGVSMILCCSHYILNLLPFLGAIVGMSWLVSLSKYTLHFLIVGVISNIIGIGVLFYQKNKYRKLKNGK